MSFSFSFSGDDIDDTIHADTKTTSSRSVETTSAPSSAFPVSGKPLLPATHHDLKHMLSALPSKIAYSTLDVKLDSGETIQLPRRELWDVRVQLMAEDEDGGEAEAGLGSHDVKTGVYEGGFKSWESSVDLVKILEQSKSLLSTPAEFPCITELGCGTALPSLALFCWAISTRTGPEGHALSFLLADYNPTVLQLVTLPNFILAWALQKRAQSPVIAEALTPEGELELSPDVIQAFEDFLSSQKISLHFLSGAWSPAFVDLIKAAQNLYESENNRRRTLILGAETIYSPFALQSFTETVFALMNHERSKGISAEALVAAKRLYFGVGGSLDDFIARSKDLGAIVESLREEEEGVRRGVVRCYLSP